MGLRLHQASPRAPEASPVTPQVTKALATRHAAAALTLRQAGVRGAARPLVLSALAGPLPRIPRQRTAGRTASKVPRSWSQQHCHCCHLALGHRMLSCSCWHQHTSLGRLQLRRMLVVVADKSPLSLQLTPLSTCCRGAPCRAVLRRRRRAEPLHAHALLAAAGGVHQQRQQQQPGGARCLHGVPVCPVLETCLARQLEGGCAGRLWRLA
jgi:hypothetical protein